MRSALSLWEAATMQADPLADRTIAAIGTERLGRQRG
jgi:hypothetical protein